MKKLSVIEMISISYEWGGIEQYVQDVAKGLTDRGHTVSVVCRDVEMYKQAYGKVCPVHVMPIRNSIDISTIRALAKLINEQQADIVHVQTSRDSWLALFATKLAGRGKVVASRHGPFPAKRDIVHTWFYNQLGAIICVSDYVRQHFLGPKPRVRTDHVHLIYPGIDTSKFDSMSKVDNDTTNNVGENKPFTVGFVGRVTVEKGVHVLLQALAKMHAEHISVHGIIVGGVNPKTPEYLDELQQFVRQQGMEQNITFYGFTDHVVDAIKQFDVLVLPSIIPEASPLVLREAMLCGKLAIGTTLGGQSEIIREGETGFLVPAEAPEELVKVLTKMIADRQLTQKMSENARDFAWKNFAISVMLDKLEQRFYKLTEK